MPTSEVAVISGKGGTGKTTVAAAFASIADGIVLADCDVDAPDMHILFQPTINEESEFSGSKVAVIDKELCTECGLCAEKCRFNAAKPPDIDHIACEGCGVCELVCPEGAARMVDRVSGHLYDSTTRAGPMAHARLMAGEGNSGKLVTEVRKLAATIAGKSGLNKVLIDGSPGVGCPVIATVTGIKLGVIVTEPTLSGIHDMERVVQLLGKFQVRPLVIINKFDLNLENTKKIEDYCKRNGIEVLGRIGFDPVMTKSMVARQTLPEYAPEHEITGQLRKMWSRVLVHLD
jgi:MinD superfamily P-loop ATPase